MERRAFNLALPFHQYFMSDHLHLLHFQHPLPQQSEFFPSGILGISECRWLNLQTSFGSLSQRCAQTMTPDGFVGFVGWLTAFVSETTMALVEVGNVLGSRQLAMGNSV